MTAETTAQPVTDARNCPRWCVADHAALILPRVPQAGRIRTHYSYTVAGPARGIRVVLADEPGAEPQVCMIVSSNPPLSIYLTPTQAEAFADLHQADCEDGVAFALRDAAAIAREQL